ncbi:hypothetical protein QF026_004790 [Streptomyces aurantiacus]|uniref:hypothetical protein n=1 Tax=Streptomyces aurantiacus TaxID=47760 RepID=UPI00278D7462|nr:hypothetical protein [Streptomyces aurantiacus]MDQ0776324.1 hypothetical protein [Streptomyces aurantiacus]
MTEMPLAYGYMRAPDDADDKEIERIEQQLYDYAALADLEMVGVYCEQSDVLAPHRFVEVLERESIRHVIVPSLPQISDHPAIQVVIVQLIQFSAGARLHDASRFMEQDDEA